MASLVLFFKSHPNRCFQKPAKEIKTLPLSGKEANTIHIFPYKTLNIFEDEEDKRQYSDDTIIRWWRRLWLQTELTSKLYKETKI